MFFTGPFLPLFTIISILSPACLSNRKSSGQVKIIQIKRSLFSFFGLYYFLCVFVVLFVFANLSTNHKAAESKFTLTHLSALRGADGISVVISRVFVAPATPVSLNQPVVEVTKPEGQVNLYRKVL